MDDLKSFHLALKSKISSVIGKADSGNIPHTPAEPSTRQTRETVTQRSRTPAEVFLLSLEMPLDTVSGYEDKELQRKALSCVPFSKIEESSLNRLRAIQKSVKKENVLELCEASAYEIVFLEELMKWFKTEFFEWVDSPPCSVCKSSTRFHGLSNIQEELKYTNRVEVYLCNNCNNRELFPRYNDARLLLQTRKGRCGEWAQCFTLFCRALKWDARYVNDQNDHVWTEVYSPFQKRWLHCDPCECAIDKPLLYEKGWNKKLDYVIAYSCDGVYDVTWRYCADHAAAISRRTIIPESTFIERISKLTESRRQGLSERRKKFLSKRHVVELVEFLAPAKSSSDESYEGRTSGSLAWRLARGEFSTGSASSGFIWIPSSEEVSAGKMVVKYLSNRDEYENEAGTKIMKGWDKGAFYLENIFRKEELDWKTVYLCRTEGSSLGVLIWKFDVSSTKRSIDTVEIKFVTSLYENGQIKLTLCGGDTCVPINSGATVFKTSELKGETAVTLKAELSGGKGSVSWQHAQLFRAPISDSSSTDTFPFIVTVTLCDDNE